MWCCFVHFDLEMGRNTTACTFSTSQLPKVVRTWGVFSFFICKCASRHNGVLFISHLARWLRTCRFSEPTFRPSRATNHWKTQCFATFLPFRASASSFLWLFLFSDILASPLLFSDSSHLCFSSVHIVGINYILIDFDSHTYIYIYKWIKTNIYIYIICTNEDMYMNIEMTFIFYEHITNSASHIWHVHSP